MDCVRVGAFHRGRGGVFAQRGGAAGRAQELDECSTQRAVAAAAEQGTAEGGAVCEHRQDVQGGERVGRGGRRMRCLCVLCVLAMQWYLQTSSRSLRVISATNRRIRYPRKSKNSPLAASGSHNASLCNSIASVVSVRVRSVTECGELRVCVTRGWTNSVKMAAAAVSLLFANVMRSLVRVAMSDSRESDAICPAHTETACRALSRTRSATVRGDVTSN